MSVVACESIEYCGTDEETKTAKPGDFILTHDSGFFSDLIRFGQALRFRGKDARFAVWNHCAVVINEQGDLIEALNKGVTQTNLSKYKSRDYVIVHIAASEEDRNEVVAFANHCIGIHYGFWHLVSLGLSLLSGLKFSFGFDEEMICSGLVATAMERTTAIFDRPCDHITPADLAKYYNVYPPAYFISMRQKELLTS